MMAFLAIPILWKKLEVTIWKPMIGKNMTTTRKPLALSWMSCESVVKAATASSGISSPTKPLVVTIVAAMTVYFITWFTR